MSNAVEGCENEVCLEVSEQEFRRHGFSILVAMFPPSGIADEEDLHHIMMN
jgi:hypothetical protein